MPQQYSYQPDAGMLQQYYATAMPQPIAQSAPIKQEQVAQYNEQGIPVAVPVIENYVPPQSQQQMPQQQMLQPDPGRLAYNKLIEDRFNELANQFGGINRLVQMDSVELAKKKAAADIASYWGPPPAIEQAPQDPRVIEIDGNKIATGGDFRSPIILPTEMEKKYKEVQLKQAEAQLTQTEAEKKFKELQLKQAQVQLTQTEKEARDKQFEKVSKLEAGANQFDQGIKVIDQILNDPRLPSSSGIGAGLANLPATEARAIAGMINQVKGQNFLNAYESLRGASGISNVEGQKAEQAMGRVDQYLTEKDLRGALLDLRERYSYAKQKAQMGLQYFGVDDQSTSQPQAMPQGQPMGQQMPQGQPAANEPMRMTSPGAIPFVRDSTGKLIRQQ